MVKQDTAEQLYQKIGIQSQNDRASFKQNVLDFMKRKTRSDDPLSHLSNLEIEGFTDQFLDSVEGVQCLTRCCGNNDWQEFHPVTKTKVFRLAKVWAKGKRKNKKTVPDNVTVDAEADKSNPILSEIPISSTVKAALDKPSSSNRLSAFAIDNEEYEDETGLHPVDDNASEYTIDDLPSTLELLDKGKRKAHAIAETEELHLPEPERTRECTEESGITVVSIASDRAPTPTASTGVGLLSPPPTRPRSARSGEEYRSDFSPAEPRVKRVRYESENVVELQQSSANERTASTAQTSHVIEDEPPENGNEVPAMVDFADSEVTGFTGTVTPRATASHSRSIVIASQEVQLTHDKLARIPIMILEYMSRCENQINQILNEDIIDKEQQKIQLVRATLLNQLVADIKSRILSMSDNKLKSEGSSSENDKPAISSYVLWASLYSRSS